MTEPFNFNLNFAGREPDYIYSARVSDHFFTVLGTPVLHGRTFLPQEYRKGGARVVILSHALWTSRFTGDPSIVGKGLMLDPGDDTRSSASCRRDSSCGSSTIATGGRNR